MSNTTNGRTPEKIKKGLECCKPVWVDNHWKTCDTKCPYIDDIGGFCRAKLIVDALALIQQLENHIGELTEMVRQLERERDEARNDLDALNYANTELHSAYEAMKRERDAAEKDLEDAFVLITKLAMILKKYPNAATNGCAYEAYTEIKRFADGLGGVQEVEHGTE